MTDAQKAARLRMAIQALEHADAWVQNALGESDATQITCTQIQEIIEDLMQDVQTLEKVAK
jgi:hypothetical protein